jgi:uncharacterized protein (TIGR02391 family)
MAGSRKSGAKPPRGKPTVTPERGIELLSGQILKAQQLLAAEPINQNDFHPWDRTRNQVEKAFGENHPNVESFEYMWAFGNSGWDPAEWAEHYAKGLKTKIATLNGYIDELKTEIGGYSLVPSVDFFNELDSAIRQVSQQLFKDSHYAESVSAAFKELNRQVQEEYKKRRGVELDGVDLMHTAFSKNNPTFALADQSTTSGKNTQQGFMELFAGSMIGIRNPHAHENLKLDQDRAKHFLYLASLLMKTFNAAL